MQESVDVPVRARPSPMPPPGRGGESTAIVRASFVRAGRPLQVDLEITPGKANRARLQGQNVSRLRDLLGEVRADTLVYACGPEPLLQAVEDVMAPWPVGSLRTERFAPRTLVRSEPDEEFEVEVPQGKDVMRR